MKQAGVGFLAAACLFAVAWVEAQTVIGGSGANVRGTVNPDRIALGEDMHGSIPSHLWVGRNGGEIDVCNGTGACTRIADYSESITAMTVFGGRMWVGNQGGSLQSCSSDGATIRLVTGTQIESLAAFGAHLWVGRSSGVLDRYDSSAITVDSSNHTFSIDSMAVYSGRLWLGLSNGELKSCDENGSCASHGVKGGPITSLEVYAEKLWLGENNGTLRSCNNAGECDDHGDQGEGISAMTVAFNELWIGQSLGQVQRCSSAGTCSPEITASDSIESMTTFHGFLCLGTADGVLSACRSDGICSAIGQTGEPARAMAVFYPTSLGNTIFVQPYRVGIGTKTPAAKLDVNGDIRVETLGSAGTTSVCRNASNQLSTCSSSQRYKSGVRPLSLGMDAIEQLQPVTFNWKGLEGFDLGFIAEDVRDVDPLLVTFNDDGEVEGVKYRQLTAVLVNALKELRSENEALEAKLSAQQNRLDELYLVVVNRGE
jgi:hypothetical protein